MAPTLPDLPGLPSATQMSIEDQHRLRQFYAELIVFNQEYLAWRRAMEK